MGRATYKGTSTKAILHHYDYLGDFYRLFLGPELVYSHAMWEDGDTLETAQMRKLDHHVQAAGAVGAERLLDVGCGYGALLHRAVQRHEGPARGGPHHKPGPGGLGRKQQWPGCEVRTENWFDHRPGRGPTTRSSPSRPWSTLPGRRLWRARRVSRYREFFRRCHGWLRPAGRLSVQANAWTRYGWLGSMMLPAERFAPGGAGPHRLGLRDLAGAWANARDGLRASRTVFPECFVPTRSELTEAAQGLFRVIAERDDPQDGVRTTEVAGRGGGEPGSAARN